MIDTSLLYPGCRVCIVDEWIKEPMPRMEPYKGGITTVKQVLNDSGVLLDGNVLMEETGENLIWFPEDIAEIIFSEAEENMDFTISSEALNNFLYDTI